MPSTADIYLIAETTCGDALRGHWGRSVLCVKVMADCGFLIWSNIDLGIAVEEFIDVINMHK